MGIGGELINGRQKTKSTLSTHAKVLADLQGPGPTAVQNAGVVAGGAAAGAATVGALGAAGGETSDEEIEDGSSDEELFDEARTALTSTKEEEEPKVRSRFRLLVRAQC